MPSIDNVGFRRRIYVYMHVTVEHIYKTLMRMHMVKYKCKTFFFHQFFLVYHKGSVFSAMSL